MCYGKNTDDSFKGSNNWFQRFMKGHGIFLKRRNNKNKTFADNGRLTIQMLHQNLRRALKKERRRNRSTIDPKYRRWTPENEYHVEQEQFPIIVDQGTTYDTIGNKHVSVSQPSSGLEKRQANFQISDSRLLRSSFQSARVEFITKLTDNLRKRFPASQSSIVSAFSVLDHKSSVSLSRVEREAKLGVLLDHYGQEKGGVKPLVDPNGCKLE